jgi:hypothetical protein
MNKELQTELINAAQSLERINDERHKVFLKATEKHRQGDENGIKELCRSHAEITNRFRKTEKLIAERMYGECEFIRVDDVIYMAYSPQNLLRIPLKDVCDLRPINTKD